jgi:hypothetical protein
MNVVCKTLSRPTGWLLLIVAAMALTACGGGSGSSSTDDTPAALSWGESNWDETVWE